MWIVIKILNIIIILSLIVIAATVAYVALPVFGNQALIVRSGSMEPTIDVGSVVVVRSQKDSLVFPIPLPTPTYSVGDIIAFRSEKNAKTIVTHRIVSIEKGTDGVFYKTKGDANKTEDGWIVSEQNILGKVTFTVPHAGRVLAFAKSDIGFPSLIIFPAVFVIVMEIFTIIKEIRTNRKKQASKISTSNDTASNITQELSFRSGLNIFIPFFIFTLGIIPQTLALYEDTESSENNTFIASADFSNPQTTPSGPQSGDVIINEIMWMGANEDTNDEWIELRNITNETVDISGWKVDGLGSGSNTITIPAGKSIPGNGFFIIANSASSSSILDVEPDHVSGSVSLANDGEQLVLKTSADIIIDTANQTPGWFAGTNTAPKKSMERNDPPGDGTVSTNWHTATAQTNLDAGVTEFATPRAANSL